MARQRVGVIFGGRSGEHEVSVRSARSVMQALDRERWEVIPFGITRSGSWLGPQATARLLAEGRKSIDGRDGGILRSSVALDALSTCQIAFPLVHGTYGEDGTLQGFLEIAGLPYAGCGVAASAIGMDKALMKALFREAGIRTPLYSVIRSWDYALHEMDAVLSIEERLGYPCFVKPANGGSSVGITKVSSREDLGDAFAAAFVYDDKAIVEQFQKGREVECSVLGNEAPQASVVGEIIPDRDYYDYQSKYAESSSTKLNIPADLPPQISDGVRDLAIRMYQVMGCEGYARIDFFVDGEAIVANEINTIPGFTSISMYPKLWEATGLSYSHLLTRILELGLERFERRSRR